MDRATGRIEQHLDHERQALRSNLDELESRARSVVDWRRQFRGNTLALLGFAFGAGVLIGLMTARRAKTLPAPRRLIAAGRPATPYRDQRRRELSREWRSIESALIGVAAAKLKDALAVLLPGFREKLGGHAGNGYEQNASGRYRS
jgi:hypothetical protein